MKARPSPPAVTAGTPSAYFLVWGLPGKLNPEARHRAAPLLSVPFVVLEQTMEGVAPNMKIVLGTGVILRELKAHAPFTTLGTLSGFVVLSLILWARVPRSVSTSLFWTVHPIHVLLSALVTTAMFRRHGGGGLWQTLSIGYFGSVGIATLSDSLLPFVGEWLLNLPHRGLHVGFIEKWWLVNPLGVGGILAGLCWPRTKFSHAGHVFLSTWASLFHITMALGTGVGLAQGLLIFVFLFLSVWIPCCTSDIVFPLLFAPDAQRPAKHGSNPVAHNMEERTHSHETGHHHAGT